MSTPDAHDPYALPPDAVADPPRTFFKALRQVGPGLILAGSIVGTGELINTTSLGAREGYTLLWLILFSCVVKVFIQVEMGRDAITNGRTSLAAIHTLPGPRLGTSWMGWLWLLMMLATQAQVAAMEGLVGQAAHMGFPGGSAAMARWGARLSPGLGSYMSAHPAHAWAAITALAAVALLLSGGYKRLEHITTALVAFVTLVTVACVAGLSWTSYPVDPEGLKAGLRFARPAAGLALAFSAFGITGVGASELFAYPYWCIEKGYARSAGARSDDPGWADRATGWLKVMRLDAWFSMLVFTAATVAFYILGAAVLKPQGLNPEGASMIDTLSMMYVGPLGAWTRSVFLVGVWAVLFKTLYVATAANSRLTGDFLALSGILRQPLRKDRERVVQAFCVIYPALALGWFLLSPEPGALVVVGGVAQALMLPLIAGATLYLGRRDGDRRVSPTFAAEAAAWFAFFAIAAVAIYGFVDKVSQQVAPTTQVAAKAPITVGQPPGTAAGR